MKTEIYLQIFDSAEDTQPCKTCIIQVLAIPEFSTLFSCPAVGWSWAGLVLAGLCYETWSSAKLQSTFQSGSLGLPFSVNSAVPTAIRKCSDVRLPLPAKLDNITVNGVCVLAGVSGSGKAVF